MGEFKVGINQGLNGAYCDQQDLMKLRWVARSLQLPKASKVSRPQSGAHRSRFRGRGMEFSEVRLYRPGDDVRSIDWRVTARREKPHTKLFNEERERPIFIICDQSQSQFFGSQHAFKSVRSAEACALLAWSALDHNDRVGGIVFSDEGHLLTRTSRSRKTVNRLLHDVAKFNQQLNIENHSDKKGVSSKDARFDLATALIETRQIAKPGTLIVVVSDFLSLTDDAEKQLSMLAKHNEFIFLRTSDPLEEQLPPPGLYAISNGLQTLQINAKNQHHRSEYAEWSRNQQARVKHIAHRCKAPLVELSTNQSAAISLQSLIATMGR